MERGDAALTLTRRILTWLRKTGLHLWGLPVLMLLLFFFLPLFSILSVMFSQPGSLSFKAILDPLFFTVFQAAVSMLLTMLLGLPVAYVVSRFRFPARKLIRMLSVLPFILPTVVVAAAFNSLLGPRGWLNLLLMKISGATVPPIDFLGTLSAILVAHVFYNISIVIRIVGSAWSQLDPRLENSARVLGASSWKVFLTVILPLLKKPILVAGLLVFLFDFTSFGVILMLGGTGFATLEVSIYTQALYMLNLPMAGLLSVVQLLFTLFITLLYSRASAAQAVPLFPNIREENLRCPSQWRQKDCSRPCGGFPGHSTGTAPGERRSPVFHPARTGQGGAGGIAAGTHPGLLPGTIRE